MVQKTLKIKLKKNDYKMFEKKHVRAQIKYFLLDMTDFLCINILLPSNLSVVRDKTQNAMSESIPFNE